MQLIARSSTPVRLTPAGHTLLPHAQRLLQAHDAACALFAGEAPPSGRLRIGAMESTAALRLPSVLAQLYQDCPDIDLQLRTGPSGALLEELQQGLLDCALWQASRRTRAGGRTRCFRRSWSWSAARRCSSCLRRKCCCAPVSGLSPELQLPPAY